MARRSSWGSHSSTAQYRGTSIDIATAACAALAGALVWINPSLEITSHRYKATVIISQLGPIVGFIGVSMGFLPMPDMYGMYEIRIFQAYHDVRSPTIEHRQEL